LLEDYFAIPDGDVAEAGKNNQELSIRSATLPQAVKSDEEFNSKSENVAEEARPTEESTSKSENDTTEANPEEESSGKSGTRSRLNTPGGDGVIDSERSTEGLKLTTARVPTYFCYLQGYDFYCNIN
jgi:hypothetical protein